MAHAEFRPLIGRFGVSSKCMVEFVPASTSVKYTCELVNRFTHLDLVQNVIRGEYVIISKWNWLGAQAGGTNIIVIDLSAVSLAKNESSMKEQPSDESSNAKTFTVRSMSAFLRIKDPQDPFNNTFCVHSTEGEIFAFRGPNMFLYRFLLTPGSILEIANFRKIKLKTCNNTLIYLSMGDSWVNRFEPFTPSLIRGSATLPYAFKGRVTGIDSQIIWITSLKDEDVKLIPLVAGRWGVCDKRRITVGSVLNIFNMHVLDGFMALCPSQSYILIEEVPPITDSVSIHTLCSAYKDNRCLFHHLNPTTTKCPDIPTQSAFGINSLCFCDCFIDCRQDIKQCVQESSTAIKQEILSQREEISFKQLFVEALKSSELCLSLLSLREIFTFKTPPFFNTSLVEPLNAKLLGPPCAEVAKSLKAIPSTIYLSLFPPQRPLNSFATLSLSAIDSAKINILVPRTFKLHENEMLFLRQVLIIDSKVDASVHGILLNTDSMTSHSVADIDQVASSFVKEDPKASRRELLAQRMRHLVD